MCQQFWVWSRLFSKLVNLLIPLLGFFKGFKQNTCFIIFILEIFFYLFLSIEILRTYLEVLVIILRVKGSHWRELLEITSWKLVWLGSLSLSIKWAPRISRHQLRILICSEWLWLLDAWFWHDLKSTLWLFRCFFIGQFLDLAWLIWYHGWVWGHRWI